MEGVIAAAQEFLEDAPAVEAAMEIDRQREAALDDLRDAFLAFRDADESISHLADRIKQTLWEVHQSQRGGSPTNLWGFVNEDERHFPARFADSAPRLPEVDLASVFRTYLKEEAETIEERVQQLLAFGEFVASVDARGADGDPRLGIGPAANFLTFAWHCLSRAEEPVFLYSSNKAIKLIAETGGLGDGEAVKGRNLEKRFHTFYRVATELAGALDDAPRGMRTGWAIEHALSWILDRIEGTAAVHGEDPQRSGLWRPRERAELRKELPAQPMIEAPSGERPGRVSIAPAKSKNREKNTTNPEKKRKKKRKKKTRPSIEAAPSSDEIEPLPDQQLTPNSAARRDRFMEVARGKTVTTQSDMGRIESGMRLEDALPPDRTKDDEPFFKKRSPREAEIRQEETARHEVKKKADTRRISRELKEQRERETNAQADTKRLDNPAASFDTQPIEKRRRQPAPPPAPPPRSQTEQAHDEVPELDPQSYWSNGADAAPKPADPKAETMRLEARGHTRAKTVRLDTKDLPARRREEPEPAVDMNALLSEFRGEVVHTSRGDRDRLVPHPDRFARDLYLEPDLVDDMLAALEQRGRLLLVGPPATGKTHIARRLALHLARREEQVLLVRLHPDMSYDDLIEGQQPGRPGLVRELCLRAQENRELRYVIILDEIDRGDAARALGEFVGALSERGQSVRLGRSAARFQVPRNVLVLATAREVPHDPALIGRFPVVTHPADATVLRRFLSHRRPGSEWVADMLSSLNQRLAKTNPGLTVGHGLFMSATIDVGELPGIWRREVLPYLSSQGVDVSSLGYDTLRPR